MITTFIPDTLRLKVNHYYKYSEFYSGYSRTTEMKFWIISLHKNNHITKCSKTFILLGLYMYSNVFHSFVTSQIPKVEDSGFWLLGGFQTSAVGAAFLWLQNKYRVPEGTSPGKLTCSEFCANHQEFCSCSAQTARNTRFKQLSVVQDTSERTKS